MNLLQNYMDELEAIRNRRASEHQQGDVKKACEQAGVTPTIFQSALRKKQIDDLTDKEMLVIQAFMNVLDKRKKDKDDLKKIIL
jgi:predicted DNA-binding protein (UPF0251 family)